MLQGWINLVFEFLAVDGAAASTSAGRITGLNHEVWNYSVDNDIIVVSPLSQRSEIIACLYWISPGPGDIDLNYYSYFWSMVIVELNNDRALENVLAKANHPSQVQCLPSWCLKLH